MKNIKAISDQELILEMIRRGLLNGKSLTQKGRNIQIELEIKSVCNSDCLETSAFGNKMLGDLDLSTRLLNLLKSKRIERCSDLNRVSLSYIESQGLTKKMIKELKEIFCK